MQDESQSNNSQFNINYRYIEKAENSGVSVTV